MAYRDARMQEGLEKLRKIRDSINDKECMQALERYYIERGTFPMSLAQSPQECKATTWDDLTLLAVAQFKNENPNYTIEFKANGRTTDFYVISANASRYQGTQ
jgi:hypothetical protein